MFRIDKLIIPSGLIRRARTYTLVIDDGVLFILNTGRATADMKYASFQFAAARGFQAIGEALYAKEIAEVEAQIGHKKDSLLKFGQEKNSFTVSLANIMEVQFGMRLSHPSIVIVTRDKKKYLIVSYDKARLGELEALAKMLSSNVTVVSDPGTVYALSWIIGAIFILLVIYILGRKGVVLTISK